MEISWKAALTSIRSASVVLTGAAGPQEEAGVMIHCGLDEPPEPEPVFLFLSAATGCTAMIKYISSNTHFSVHTLSQQLFSENLGAAEAATQIKSWNASAARKVVLSEHQDGFVVSNGHFQTALRKDGLDVRWFCARCQLDEISGAITIVHPPKNVVLKPVFLLNCTFRYNKTDGLSRKGQKRNKHFFQKLTFWTFRNNVSVTEQWNVLWSSLIECSSPKIF